MTAALVPELVVSDLGASLGFWCDLVGFRVWYDRPEEGFAYLVLGDAHLMLEQLDLAARQWITADLVQPYGRGINFQIEVPDIDAVIARCTQRQLGFYLQPEERWYRRGAEEVGLRQCIAQDPDGYLARLQQPIGTRVLGSASIQARTGS